MLSPKKEKKFLESCMTLIHYSHDQDSFFTKCKIRIICIIIFFIGFISWFILFYGEYFNYHIRINSASDIIEQLVAQSFLVFILPFFIGCVVTAVFLYFYSKHIVWRYLKLYIDQNKLLNRISLLESEISDCKRKKS